MKKVCIIVTTGFEELEAVGTYALLKRCGLGVDIYSLTGEKAEGRFGLHCTHLHPLSTLRAEEYDALVLPGGPQYKALEASHEVKQLLISFIRDGKVVAALCASPTILGHAGYLTGKQYTCFTEMDEDFGGTFTGQYATTDGNIITGQSAAATVDFAFAIAEKLLGKEHVDEVKHSIYYK